MKRLLDRLGGDVRAAGRLQLAGPRRPARRPELRRRAARALHALRQAALESKRPLRRVRSSSQRVAGDLGARRRRERRRRVSVF